MIMVWVLKTTPIRDQGSKPPSVIGLSNTAQKAGPLTFQVMSTVLELFILGKIFVKQIARGLLSLSLTAVLNYCMRNCLVEAESLDMSGLCTFGYTW